MSAYCSTLNSSHKSVALVRVGPILQQQLHGGNGHLDLMRPQGEGVQLAAAALPAVRQQLGLFPGSSTQQPVVFSSDLGAGPRQLGRDPAARPALEADKAAAGVARKPIMPILPAALRRSSSAPYSATRPRQAAEPSRSAKSRRSCPQSPEASRTFLPKIAPAGPFQTVPLPCS